MPPHGRGPDEHVDELSVWSRSSIDKRKDVRFAVPSPIAMFVRLILWQERTAREDAGILETPHVQRTRYLQRLLS